MKVFTPEISWHNRLPALSLDISKIDNESCHQYRIATGGNDCRVYVWSLTTHPTFDITIRAGLRRHQRSVGAVKFSSRTVDGIMLASGDDDGYIYIWKCIHNNEPNESNAFLNDDGFEDLETWQQQRVLRGHLEDICDIAWSKDGHFILSGSVDNSAILWDVKKGTRIWTSDSIKGYVQGVTIDSNNQFMAVISSDRTLRIYNYAERKLMHTVRRLTLREKQKALFCDDTVQTFCRRLDFSPDGQYLLAPTCRIFEDTTPSSPIVIAFKRTSLNKPALYYPTGSEIALCVRFSPVLYTVRDNNAYNFWGCPYRMIFAVATSRSIILYDSQQKSPIGYISQIHLARLTDISWSEDGLILMVTSYDGYSTLIKFEPNELGQLYDGPMMVDQPEEEQCEEKPLRRGQKRSVPEPEPKETSTMWRYITKAKKNE